MLLDCRCDKTEGCAGVAIRAAGGPATYQGFPPVCTPWAQTGPVGKCVTVPGNDWVSLERIPPNRWGRDFVGLILAAAVLYLGGGGMFLAVHGKRGRELLPQPGFWAAVASLVIDGCAFTRVWALGDSGRPAAARGKAADAGKAGEAGPREKLLAGPAASAATKKSKRSRDGGGSGGRKKKAELGADTGNDRPGAASAPETPAQPAVSEAAGTPAGGGGRWVHVPD
eukprot:SAG22_NODE_203_length_15320_cov_14.023516_12_plen_226_part_00